MAGLPVAALFWLLLRAAIPQRCQTRCCCRCLMRASLAHCMIKKKAPIERSAKHARSPAHTTIRHDAHSIKKRRGREREQSNDISM